ncbi:beta-galactosidase [Saccharibacillus alkalitolerans]|uniref:Glycoside hydrolase n=1 Tax=Saccharibacillus alkalitolerans TaxID=2705290 RepID=A0ABX0F9L2_9BACL|nr:beta-galactosidase [Saccharibacillus alkalitolerans]NGZ77633.1 glycoside hydrolase [Saccharibacillus alkalitolerans]
MSETYLKKAAEPPNKRLIFFRDPSFPASGPLPGLKELGAYGVVTSAADLGDALTDRCGDGNGVLINLHAPYFPESAWSSILAFLKKGGGLLSVGGAPFKRPVRQESGRWRIGPEQTGYHQQLFIHETLPVEAGRAVRLEAAPELPLLSGDERLFAPETGASAGAGIGGTWNLVPHTTRDADLPEQMGSAGTMSTRITPLLRAYDASDRPISAPAVLWEQMRGPFAGSRWVFVNRPLTAGLAEGEGLEALSRWAAFCGREAAELSLAPHSAAYEPGERARLTLRAQAIRRAGVPADLPAFAGQSDVGRLVGGGKIERIAKSGPGRGGEADGAAAERSAEGAVPAEGNEGVKASDSVAAAPGSWTFRLSVASPTGEEVFARTLAVPVTYEWTARNIPLPFDVEPGLYTVNCVAESPEGEVRVLKQGFWGRDQELLASGRPISAGRDYFLQDGRPLPIVGMTYMTSDVARKFLFLPNAAVWDRDMAAMAKAGINWIRTGIWTAYRNVMQVDGHASEEVLRAIDAFLLTAAKHDLHVTFTFFSFTPETWEGKNPYLDPQSVEAQKRFIRSIVSRHVHSTHVDWDLINEPSMFDPARIFSAGPRSMRDEYERAAFVSWLKRRHGSIQELREHWNMTPAELPSFEDAAIPEAEEINFDVQDMHKAKKGARWLDYCLFSVEMHSAWAAELTESIKRLAPDHLVTVGQDEGLGAQRPSPLFYEDAVDYTTVHSWWLNDSLVWDGVFTKTPDKPNVIQETGIMYVETPDGRAKRSEAELRNFLERKYAYAFSTGGAGAIQWIWNTNFYMDNANESHIGALRADGTEKPEADVSYDFGRFMAKIRDLFAGRRLEDVAAVFPYSNDFSNRSFAVETTNRLTRVLAYGLKLPLRAVSEYRLDSLKEHPAKLILLPSPHNMDEDSMKKLLRIAKSTHATLVITGPAGLDAYWHESDRADKLLGIRTLHNVRREEMLELDGRRLPVSFGGRRIAETLKEIPADAEGRADRVLDVPNGRGRLIWSPLPLELGSGDEPIAELYRYAAKQAGVIDDLEWLAGGELAGVYGRKLTFASGSLYVFVSEYAWDAEIEVRDRTTGRTYGFVLESERSVLFAADGEGAVTAVYRPEEVEIRVGG